MNPAAPPCPDECGVRNRLGAFCDRHYRRHTAKHSYLRKTGKVPQDQTVSQWLGLTPLTPQERGAVRADNPAEYEVPEATTPIPPYRLTQAGRIKLCQVNFLRWYHFQEPISANHPDFQALLDFEDIERTPSK